MPPDQPDQQDVQGNEVLPGPEGETARAVLEAQQAKAQENKTIDDTAAVLQALEREVDAIVLPEAEKASLKSTIQRAGDTLLASKAALDVKADLSAATGIIDRARDVIAKAEYEKNMQLLGAGVAGGAAPAVAAALAMRGSMSESHDKPAAGQGLLQGWARTANTLTPEQLDLKELAALQRQLEEERAEARAFGVRQNPGVNTPTGRVPPEFGVFSPPEMPGPGGPSGPALSGGGRRSGG